MWQALISPITSLLGQVLKNKAEEKAAVHTAKMQVIQNTASWEQLMASASATSWKDEWFTLLLSAPVVALMWGIGMNDLEIIERIGYAFTELDRLPDWYQYLLFMAVSASFGIRGADKLLALKGKKQMAELDIFADTTTEERFFDNPLAMATEASEEESGPVDYGMYGSELNWEDTVGAATAHLGVTEDQWKNFIEGVNSVKTEMAKWSEGGGNAARVMQERSTPEALLSRRIAVLLNQNPGMTADEARAQVTSSEEYQKFVKDYEYYTEMNDVLNQLYASVGLDNSGSITGGTGTSHGNGYTVSFDFITGDTTHNKGNAIHDFGKGLVMGIGAAMFGAGLTGFLSAPAGAGVAAGGGLGLAPSTASAISKFITAAMSGEGLSIEGALSLAFGPGGEFADVAVDVQEEIIGAVTDYVTNPDNYSDDNQIVWETHGGTDGTDGVIVNIPNYEEYYEEEDGGGGAAEDPSADADNDGVPASQDPDDNNPDVPVQGGTEIVNETDEEVTTGGEEVESDGTPVGLEYRWKYIGDGCFVQIDENGQEIPDTKVCDPDYTEEDYELYEVGGIFGRGTDAPFGTPEGDDEDDTTPVDEPPAAGTQTEDCLSNGDKIIYTADGEGNWETEVIAGGCLEKEEGEDDGGITLGGSPVWDGGADDGGDAEAGDADSGDADTDADGDGTEGAGDTGAGDDGAGDDGTGEGDGGDGEGDGDGNGQKEVSLGGGMMGKPASFQGMMAGLSYEPQPIPGIRPTPQIDYTADLEELIARQLKNRGMFT